MEPYPGATEQLPPPTPHHHWYRPRHIVIGTGVVIAAAIAICASTSGGDHPAAKASPAAAAAVPSITPTPTQAAPTITPIEDWMTSDGYSAMTTVQADIANVHDDAQAGDVTAVEDDGVILAQDARIAADEPPPVDARDYTAAMLKYARSGDLMQQDDFEGATRYLDQGTKLIVKVTAQLKQMSA